MKTGGANVRQTAAVLQYESLGEGSSSPSAFAK